ncbi:MAG: 50S ribosomal protein L6 [Bacteroidota bacterium]
MSRVGRKPVALPAGVTVRKEGGQVTVSGPKGNLARTLHPAITMEIREEERQILFQRPSDSKEHKALHGLWRALVQNMVNGVTQGYQRKLELVGVGYRAELKGRKLQLQLGYSHPILFAPPEGISIEVPSQTAIMVSGTDKQLVGQVAAKIRSFRPPEPYKGKGVKYEGEFIRRKAGKAAAASGAK